VRIRSVTVGLGLTESMPGYGNVKPSLTLTADLDPSDNASVAVQTLDALVTHHCQDKVDDTLEAEGYSPKFHDGPLYRLAYWKQRDAVFILPVGTPLEELPGEWHYKSAPLRLPTTRKRAATIKKDVLEYSDGNLQDLFEWWDAQEWFVVYRLVTWLDHWHKTTGKFVLVPHDLIIPEGLEIRNATPHTLEHHTGDLKSSERLVVRDQQKLDKLVEQWLAEHPRPEGPF